MSHSYYNRYRRVIAGGEIGEPVSWVLGILAVLVAWVGFWGLFHPLSYYVVWSATGILLGFLVHEAMHKYTARRYGFISEFVASMPWLTITILSSFLPFRILAPGYVRILAIRTYSPKQAVIATAAGPASNIALAAILLGVYTIVPGARIAAEVNAWLAFFNLLPIPPLDGSKIAEYDMRLWALLFIIAVVLMYLT